MVDSPHLLSRVLDILLSKVADIRRVDRVDRLMPSSGVTTVQCNSNYRLAKYKYSAIRVQW